MLFAAMTAITFTSCDKDDMISDDLKGTWKGDMYQVSEYGGKRYNASYTELYFETSAFRTARGIGKWIDHYSNNPYYDYFASNIDWQVKDQIIYITFKNGDRTTLEIRNYDIDRDRFYGDIWLGDSWLHFNMYHVDSPNWSKYKWDGYHYTVNKARQTSLVPGTKPATQPEEEPQRMLNTDKK